MGTVKIDIGSRLGTHRFGPNDIYEVASVVARAGGTAVNFASAASSLFETLHIIAAIGDDGLTGFLAAALEGICSSASLQRCANQVNAMVLTVRDAPDENGRCSRLLVSSDQSPHAYLTAAHVLACRNVIESSDFFVCDGYALQHDTSSFALLTALDLAQRAQVRTVLDLVPHNLPSTMSKRHVAQAIAHADIIVAEARTIVGLHDQRWPVSFDSDVLLLDRAVEAARTIGPSATWILRYGFENIENTQMLCPDGTRVDYCTTYRRETDRHLYGDRLLATELYSILTDSKVNPPSHTVSP